MKTRFLSGIAIACLLASVNPYLGGKAASAQTTMVNGKQLSIADLANLPPLVPGAGDGDYRLAPPYANAPELTPRDDVPKGMVYRFTMNSTDSKLYPGIAKDRPGRSCPIIARRQRLCSQPVCPRHARAVPRLAGQHGQRLACPPSSTT